MVFNVKTFRHPAIDRIAIFYAVFKWQARQVAVKLVSPLVIRANETTGIAVLLLAKAHATMCAAVFNNPDAMVKQAVFGCNAITHHQHLTLSDMTQFVVAQVGDFNFQADITPMRAVKNLVQLLLVKLCVGINQKGMRLELDGCQVTVLGFKDINKSVAYLFVLSS